MVLSVEETILFTELGDVAQRSSSSDTLCDLYYQGQQRLEHIGIAVPPELRRFETVVNWPRTAVDSIEERIDKKSLILPGTETADPGLEEGWEVNNLDSEASLVHLDAFIYGRGAVSVGANEDDPGHPLISIESPREVTFKVDTRKRRVVAALRLYGVTLIEPEPQLATLYLRDVTVWLEKSEGRWVETDRDPHRLGRVPMIPFLNRPRSGRRVGESEMSDVVPLTDSAARAITNLQIAIETHSVPQKWVLGMSKGDFVDADGNPIPAWQSYFSAIWANRGKPSEIAVGQFTASDLSNFHNTINHYAGLVAGVTGLPMRYLGQNTANPPSADGIRADEARLVKRAERKMQTFGDQWGRVLAYYLRIRDGEWVDGNRIKVEWHDAATPTVAARADAVAKMKALGIYSREGSWDELGWSEARKSRERAYFDAEALDPISQALLRGVNPDAPPAV